MKKKKIKLEDWIINPHQTLAIIKIPEEEKLSIVQRSGKGLLIFEKKEKASILREINGDTSKVLNCGKRITTLTTEYLDMALRLLESWSGMKDFNIMATNKKDESIIIYRDTLGIIIAPRVEMEDFA